MVFNKLINIGYIKFIFPSDYENDLKLEMNVWDIADILHHVYSYNNFFTAEQISLHFHGRGRI